MNEQISQAAKTAHQLRRVMGHLIEAVTPVRSEINKLDRLDETHKLVEEGRIILSEMANLTTKIGHVLEEYDDSERLRVEREQAEMSAADYALWWIKRQGASNETRVSDWFWHQNGDCEVTLLDEKYDNMLTVLVWRDEHGYGATDNVG